MTQADAQAPAPQDASPAPAPRPRPRAPRILAGLVLFALVAGGGISALRAGHESTDDAQIEGHLINVAARVPGQVLRVLARENQVVQVGDPLVELDPGDYAARQQLASADLASARAQLAVAQAQAGLTETNVDANLTQARGGLRQASGSVESFVAAVAQARADVDAARARERLAGLELARTSRLRQAGAAAAAELDARQAAYDTARAALSQAEARLRTASANTESSQGAVGIARGRFVAADTGALQVQAARAQVALAEARVQQATASLRLAELNLSYTRVTAPQAGQVSRKSVEVGQQVSPERALLALIPLAEVWVVANFKEDQLAAMKPGQRAQVKVDGYGSRRFSAQVESLAAATGSRFSLLPGDNASGNFVKVTQRVPVRLVLIDAGDVVLRPGMSAEVTVFTR